jgi:hypothetical protein
MKHEFDFLTITDDGKTITLEMTEEQRLKAEDYDLFDEDDKVYIECMKELFEDVELNSYFYWWDGIHNPLGLTEAPYISTQLGYDEEADTFMAAGRIYFFPKYQILSELEMLKAGEKVIYQLLE